MYKIHFSSHTYHYPENPKYFGTVIRYQSKMSGGFFMFLFFLIFFGIQIFILFCCAAAGNDAASQELSDLDQLQFITEWKKHHGKKDVC